MYLKKKKKANVNVLPDGFVMGNDDSDEEVTEALIEYEMGKEFIVTIMEDPDGDFGFMSQITPKSYYDNTGATYDQHLDYILNLPEHFEELAEGTFASEKTNVECIDELVKLGIKFNEKYHDDMESHAGLPNYTVNGVRLFDYIRFKYPEAIV